MDLRPIDGKIKQKEKRKKNRGWIRKTAKQNKKKKKMGLEENHVCVVNEREGK